MKIEEKTPQQEAKNWPRLMRGGVTGDIYIAYEKNGMAFSIKEGITIDNDLLEDLPAGFTVTLTNE